MNDARNSMRDDRGRRGWEKTLIFFCSSRVRVCARIFDAHAKIFAFRRRLGNFETMAPGSTPLRLRAGLFSNAPTYTNTPMEFRSCPREFDEKVVREKTGEQARELVFSSFFLLFSIARGDCCCWCWNVCCVSKCVLTNFVCFGVGRRNALGDDALINMFQQQFLPFETGGDAEKKVSPSPESKLVISIITIIIIFFFLFKSSSSRAEGRRRRQRGVTMRRWRRLITSNRISAAGLLSSFSFW